MISEREAVIEELSKMPGVSEKTAEGMYLLGIRSLEDLKGRKGEDMYEQLRNRSDFFAEPCMLNQLKIAVKMASMND
ncbi:MAG: pathogenicity locus [Methanomassiliicoccales archaeon]|nr:pathogenicity locus [Methanomassiliicoccales archaeon]NYT16087.1 pathogenicity locus [Methanomassiliicoccales archaeon]